MSRNTLFMATLAAAAIAVGWLIYHRPRRNTQTGVLPPDDIKDFWTRPSSFSLVIFSGDHLSDLPGFLAQCGYEVLDQNAVTALPADIYAGLPDPSGPSNAIVYKAVYERDGFTVLMDPEMVVLTQADRLTQFCRAHKTRATCVAWERVSQTAALVEVTESGVSREAWYLGGSASQPPMNPPHALASQPDATGLLKSLADLGVSRNLLTIEASATRLKLKE